MIIRLTWRSVFIYRPWRPQLAIDCPEAQGSGNEAKQDFIVQQLDRRKENEAVRSTLADVEQIDVF